MAHRGYSSWDRVTGTGRKVPTLDRAPGESKAQARCRARIDAFRSAIDESEAEAAPLARELKKRRKFWHRHFAHNGSRDKLEKLARYSPKRMMLYFGLISISFLASIMVIGFVPALFGSRFQWPVLSFIFMPFGMMAFGLFNSPSFRTRRTLVFSLCPDCEYSLKELPDAIELPGDERTGPIVCPECGCPWPLIPPRR